MGIDRALNRGYIAGVLVVIALLAINAAVAYRNTRQLNDDAYWVSHTQEALDALEEANSAMRGAEAAERGFLITGNPNYSKHYEEIADTILPKLDHLRELTVDNSVQQAQVLELRQEIKARLALLATDIAARKHEAENSRFVSVSEPGQAAFESIRDHFAAMRAEEHRLLREREPATAQAYRVSVVTNVLAALLGLVLVGLLVYLLRRDLLARMKAAAAVEEQREWLHTTLASIGDAVIATDALGNVTFMNAIAQSLTGWAQADAAAHPLVDVFKIENEQTRKPVEHPVARVLREGSIVGLANHTVLIARDGTERPIDDSAAPIKDAAGKILGVVMVFRDVTEHRRTEGALRQSEEQFRQAILDAPIPILMHAEDGELLEVSKAWTRMSGYDKQEVGDYEGWLARAYGDAATVARTRVQHAFQCNETPAEQEVSIRTRNGEERVWLLTASAPGLLRDGRKFLVEMATDVTERKREADVSKFLSDASATLSALVDTHSTLQKVAHMAVPFFADWCVVDLADEEGHLQRLAVAHHDPDHVFRAKESDGKVSSRSERDPRNEPRFAHWPVGTCHGYHR